MWKDIMGFESAYEISDSGVVRSKDRMCVDSKGRKRFRKGQVLNPDIASNGYYIRGFNFLCPFAVSTELAVVWVFFPSDMVD